VRDSDGDPRCSPTRNFWRSQVCNAPLRAALAHAARCCHRQQLAQDPATFSKVKPLVPQLSYLRVASREGASATRPTPLTIKATREVFGRPAPISLAEQSLRL